MQTNHYQRIKRYLTETTFNIWLRLVGLTLVSAIIAETKNTTIVATVFVCAIVIVKGHWIIEEFMGLKHAAPLFRKIIKGYFYAMTTLVGVIVAYSQASFLGV
ncbi:cytochrome C oxidase subunit IV family protein [Colwellia sp. MSW7]|uniref:Cytochrome C oxidase subunit IV family protein n=1 Tax=Colwellia maritima TaxID=2912588 RepID=A0ABS9WX24_9GAMM|nr:cytochrome C oxidase subunit IV family protein [Colwellia maritima]MCI2282499.1 cytochrome C oxidase subunit IV family protein [Colwellia maritima]